MPQVVRPAASNGLFIDVLVGVSAGLRAQLWKKGIQVPPQVSTTFIIDTGADTTMVDEQTMRTLQLNAIDTAKVLTSESKGVAEECEVFDIGFEIPNRGQQSFRFEHLRVLARPLMNQSAGGMIGRDILDKVLFTYNGPEGSFSIDYPTPSFLFSEWR